MQDNLRNFVNPFQRKLQNILESSTGINSSWSSTSNNNVSTWNGHTKRNRGKFLAHNIGTENTILGEHFLDKHLKNRCPILTENELLVLRRKITSLERGAVEKRKQLLQANTDVNCATRLSISDETSSEKSQTSSSWGGLVDHVSFVAGSVGKVASKIPTLGIPKSVPKLPPLGIPSTVPKLNIPMLIPSKPAGMDAREPLSAKATASYKKDMTDVELIEKTRQLVKSLDGPTAMSKYNPLCCIKPLENLCLHFHLHPWTVGTALREGAVGKVLLMKHYDSRKSNHENDDSPLAMQARETLGLLGYHEPPSGIWVPNA